MSPDKERRIRIDLPEWAQVTPRRRAHIEGVAWLLERWALELRVGEDEQCRWLKAAALHDAVKDAPSEELRRLAPDAWGVAKLRHGPAAAELAYRHGERDQGVLDAVRYHSVGFAGWDAVGRMLYLADYLEPGRTHRSDALEALRARVVIDPPGVLCSVAEERMEYLRARGRTVLQETLEFWESLRCGA